MYTFILEHSAVSIPIRALSASSSRFSAISPPLDLVSSRGLRPAIALSREGLARVRVRPRRGRTRSASEVARSRLRGLPHAPQSQPCFDSPVSRLPGLPHAPQSQPRFFTTTSLSGSEIAHTRWATETQHNSLPETPKGSWPLLLPRRRHRRRCCCWCCCCASAAAAVLLLLCCCCC